jgi:ATP-dependent RNA helicase DeaD
MTGATPPLHPVLSKALSARGYEQLTPVQLAVAAPNLAERDLLVSSKTGSGKTVAYGLGLASAILGDLSLADEGAEAAVLPAAGKPLALIVAPTRELALQVQRELEWLYANAHAVIAACVGGMDPRAERRQLERGAHIVVGTPGRLVDHLTRGALDLSVLAAIVLDEADEMLDLGFRDDLEFILERTPEARRSLLFSATLPKAIVTLASKFQRNALRIEVAGGERSHSDIEYRAVMVPSSAIEHGVVNLLRHVDAPASLVFCNTRDAVRHLHAMLTERGFSAVILSGELGQHERNQALQALRDGRAKVCIATDVAARGIDLPNLGLVIHADLPHDAEVLQHRSGRTGRAGRKGISVIIIPPARRRKAERLLQDAGVRPSWMPAPTAEEIRLLDRERLLNDPILTDETSEEDRAMASALLAARPAEEVAAALARLYRQRLPVVEEIELMQVVAPKTRDGANANSKPGAEREAFTKSPSRWFELDIGRQDNAEPKGVLRLLLRRGDIEKRFVGAIRLQESTCQVEIAAEAADLFARNAPSSNPNDVQIKPIDTPSRGFSPRSKDKEERSNMRPPHQREKSPN